MNCLEAQSKIVAFVEDKLEGGELLEFVRHVRSCENCAEELEIYYTLLVGMKQLDEDQELSTDFKAQMEEKLNIEYKHIQNRRKLTGSTIVIILAGLCTAGFLGYESFRNTRYLQEQADKKAQQSEYYYYDFFGGELFHNEDYELFNLSDYMAHTGQEQKDSSYYERLRIYLNQHKGDDEN
ncbi:MAG: zf-HC2 domain-containing protein [Bacteroides sp.]|nr:zf-HC2 domain-containing protein [Bacteroides sp.]MCM1550885.1 zf-HC2 domain-containing protein [Clostridium sp.]